MMVAMVDREDNGPISLHKKNAFNNDGSDGHELENVTCKEIFTQSKILKKNRTRFLRS